MTSGIRKIVFSILLLGVVYVGYQYMIKPANRSLFEKKARTETKLAKLTQLDNSGCSDVTAEYLDEQLEKLQEAIKSLEDRLPPTSEIDKVLRNVTVIVQKQGLNPKTIRTLKQKNNNGYIEQPLKMELTGNFNSFYSFLLELERLPRIMKIRNLEMKKCKDKEGMIGASFVVSIFFQNNFS